jgi:uncharacterized membrane protein YphA (DoxX/SURF4 family)
MLNLVPITFLALFGYAILRVVTGSVWCWIAIRHYQERHTILPTLHIPFFPWPKTALVLIFSTELIVGILFILGLWTQVAAIVSALWCIKLIVLRSIFQHKSFPDRLTIVLLLAISITLFITGAGAPAFDLPI